MNNSNKTKPTIVLASPSLQPEFNPKIPQDGRRGYPLAYMCFLSPTGLGERHLDFKTLNTISFLSINY